MTVESEILDFKQKLIEEVTTTPLIWFITPKKFNGKSFCGYFDDNEFDLVKNSNFVFIRHIEVKGEYKKENNKTIIKYTISENKITRKIFQIVFILGLTISLIFIGLKMFKVNIDNFFPFLIISIFFVFISILNIVMKKIAKQIVKTKFQEIFKIN